MKRGKLPPRTSELSPLMLARHTGALALRACVALVGCSEPPPAKRVIRAAAG